MELGVSGEPEPYEYVKDPDVMPSLLSSLDTVVGYESATFEDGKYLLF